MPWFWPLLIPAGLLIIINMVRFRSAYKAYKTSESVEIDVASGSLSIGGEAWARETIRIELLPNMIRVLLKVPPDYGEMEWSEQKKYARAFLTLYLPEPAVERLTERLEAGACEIQDSRALVRWGLLGMYGLVVAVVIGLLAWRALLWGGVAAVFKGSEMLGGAFGIHPVLMFFLLAALGLVLLLARAVLRHLRR